MAYEALQSKFPHLTIKEVSGMPKGLAGLYLDNTILLNRNRNRYEKHCILAEEIGHHLTAYGDITNPKDIRHWKIELKGRRWAYERLVSPAKIIECYQKGITTLEEVCQYLEVTVEFLKASLEHYTSKYGLCIKHDKYIIEFDPLNVHAVKNK